jgi:hypothetical protein
MGAASLAETARPMLGVALLSTTMTPQMEVEVSVMDVERPGVAVTSQTKMAWLETPLSQEG